MLRPRDEPCGDGSLQHKALHLSLTPGVWRGLLQQQRHFELSLETLQAQAAPAALFLAVAMSFLVYGVLQERVMSVGFGAEQEHFRWSLFVVFCNRLMTTMVAILLTFLQKTNPWPVAPLQSYAAVSLGNLVASTCQYDSLRYVSFAVQTLAKCCKMVPVVVWGVILGTRHSLTEVSTAGSVLAGSMAFIFSGNILSSSVDDPHAYKYYGIGLLQLALYLAFDGFASTWQEKLFSGYQMDTGNQVLYTTLCSTMFSVVVLLAGTDMSDALAFLRRHPDAWVYILAVSTVATLIQYFVSYTIKKYGALNFATMMTARQFFSILASCWIFDHSFTRGQWFGTIIVFATLMCRMLHKQKAAALKTPLSPPARDISSLVKLPRSTTAKTASPATYLPTLSHRAESYSSLASAAKAFGDGPVQPSTPATHSNLLPSLQPKALFHPV